MSQVSPYLIVPLVAIVISQVIKFAAYSYSEQIDFRQLFKFGGSPSSRVAAVLSVMVAAIAVDGFNTSVAGLAVVGGVLYIWEKYNKDNSKPVITGGLIGLITGLILSVTYWRDSVDWFFDKPSSSEIKIQLIGFGLLLVVAEILCFITRRKGMRKLPTSRKLNRAFRISLTLPAILGLAFTFAQKETLGLFDARIWIYLVILSIVLAKVWFWWSVYRHAAAHLAEEAVHFKKTKVIEKKKKKTTKKKKRK